MTLCQPLRVLAGARRHDALALCTDNSRRPHSALGGQPPTGSLLKENVLGDNDSVPDIGGSLRIGETGIAMQAPAIPAGLVRSRAARRPARLGPRSALAAATVLALAAGAGWGLSAPQAGLDADLVRVLRFMAVIKLAFAVIALAASWWRLARPASGWRTAAYIGGPPLAVGGAMLLLALHDLGIAALALHGGLLAVLAAALTDRDFFATPQA